MTLEPDWNVGNEQTGQALDRSVYMFITKKKFAYED